MNDAEAERQHEQYLIDCACQQRPEDRPLSAAQVREMFRAMDRAQPPSAAARDDRLARQAEALSDHADRLESLEERLVRLQGEIERLSDEVIAIRKHIGWEDGSDAE